MLETLREMRADLETAWGWYSGLDAEAQRLLLLAVAAAVIGLIGWILYQSYGYRTPEVVLAGLARRFLLILVLAVVGLGRLFGRRWRVPRKLKQSWTNSDPDRPLIPRRVVKPMEISKRD